MSISAASFSVDDIVRGGPGKSIFDDGKAASTSNSTWHQGSQICFDTGLLCLRAVTATADAATIVGIADNVVTSGKLAGPYDGLTAVDAAQVSPGFAGPKYGVTARLKLKTGDAFNIGSKVYLADGQDDQTVSSVNPGDANHVGIYVGLSATASAAAGATGDILYGCRYPNGTAGTLSLG
jgi:hypothetical protein